MERKRESGKLPEQKAKRQSRVPDTKEINSNVPQLIHEKLENPPITVSPRTFAEVNAPDAVSLEKLHELMEKEVAMLEMEEDILTTEVTKAQEDLDDEQQYQKDLKRFLEE